MHVVVSEVLQEPEPPCRPHPGDILIEHDGGIEVHPAKLQDMFDGPHEGLQRFWRGIIQAQAEQVKMRRPGNPALLHKGVDRPDIDDAQIRVAEARRQLLRRPEQIRIGITLIDHVACSPLSVEGRMVLSPAEACCTTSLARKEVLSPAGRGTQGVQIYPWRSDLNTSENRMISQGFADDFREDNAPLTANHARVPGLTLSPASPPHTPVLFNPGLPSEAPAWLLRYAIAGMMAFGLENVGYNRSHDGCRPSSPPIAHERRSGPRPHAWVGGPPFPMAVPQNPAWRRLPWSWPVSPRSRLLQTLQLGFGACHPVLFLRLAPGQSQVPAPVLEGLGDIVPFVDERQLISRRGKVWPELQGTLELFACLGGGLLKHQRQPQVIVQDRI